MVERRRRRLFFLDCFDYLFRKDRYKFLFIFAVLFFCVNMLWDMFNVYNWSRRLVFVLSDDTSYVSVIFLDFECDIIGIDDL